MVITIVALPVRTLPADETPAPKASASDTSEDRGFLEPLTDLAFGNDQTVLPPLPPAGPTVPVPTPGRARFVARATATAQYAYRWNADNEEIVLLRGRCTIRDDGMTLMADEIVIWHDKTDPQAAPIVYLSGHARMERSGRSRAEPALLTTLTASAIDYDIPPGGFIEEPQTADPLYQRAVARRALSADPQTHTAARGPDVSGPKLLPSTPANPIVPADPIPDQGVSSQIRRVRIYPRSAVPFNVESVESTNSIPPEQVTVLTGGVNILIDSINREIGIVDLRADRVVIWTQTLDTAFQSEQIQTKDTPLTVYLEGNIVILQAGHKITAERAVYDARTDRALIINAELRSYVPELQSDIRIRARQIRQLSRDRYHAINAWSTTSVFGKPSYRVQSNEIFLESRYDVDLRWMGAGSTVVDPATGMDMVQTNWVRSYGNTVFIHDVPVLYSPYLAGPAEEIKIPLKSLLVGRDQIFGVRAKTAWDPFQLFGLEEPQGVQLRLLADYYSKRGPGGGLSGKYSGDDLFGLNDHFRGTGIGYYIHDKGHDRLGRLRNDLPLTTQNRWRFEWRHRHNLPLGINVNAELGVLSDRNILEQYFEREFDNDKDQENLLYATQSLEPLGLGNWSWEALGKAPLNDFETVTGWYPKVDLWGLSEPFFDGWLTWSSHSVAGYGDLHPADPSAYTDEVYFQSLPYMPSVQGGNFMTRHQLDLPIPIGPLKVVPFAMGEAAFWQQGIKASDIGRLTSSVGVRSSIQFQRVFPGVYNRVLGLKGLAHKIRLEGLYRATNTSQPFGSIAQYNNIDDNAQERLRYRIPGAYFGGNLPFQLNPRFYGIRSGVGTALGSPYYELIEDQQVARLAVRQRLQTKAGPPGNLRIRDWMTLDSGLSLFPKADRDNFGQSAGLIFTDYSWLVSERTRFVANLQLDLYDNASKLWNVGFRSKRSQRGTIYLGLRHLTFAQIESDMIIASYTYVMSPKWLSSLRATVDVKDTQNMRQAIMLTRVGADFLVHLGIQNNSRTENFGVTFAIEPRFGNFQSSNASRLSSLVSPPINP